MSKLRNSVIYCYLLICSPYLQFLFTADKISEYFGVKIAFYFAWLGHYTSALIVPALVGLLFWVLLSATQRRSWCHPVSLLQILFKGKGEFLDDLGFVLFSFFNVVWATLYLESWKRRQAELSHQWGTIDTKGALLSEPRVQYQVQILSTVNYLVSGTSGPYFLSIFPIQFKDHDCPMLLVIRQ